MGDLFENLGPFVSILINLGLFLIGIILIRKFFVSKRKARACLSWPSVSGRVTKSGVSCTESRDDEDNSITYTYKPDIQYSYQVAGKEYHSNQVLFGGFNGTRKADKPQLVANKYPLNATVAVFYDPNNPREAVLERSAGSGAKSALFGGLLLIIVSILMAYLTFAQ